MVDFYHSAEAENVMHLFYSAEKMVYVEGVDDVPFWELIFKEIVDYPVEVQDVGGSKELEKYAIKVINDELQAIIACDSDFEVLKAQTVNRNIIRTFGYAIENSLICPITIEKVIKAAGKLSAKQTPVEKINQWISCFNSSVELLVYYDIYNELEACGISVMSDNCSKFLKSKNSHDICENKISAFIDNLNFKLSEEDINKIRGLLNQSHRKPCDFVRGHFLFSAVAKFVSLMIKKLHSKTSFSNDALFGSLLLAFENTFNYKHPHFEYYKNAIEDLGVAA